MIPIPKEAYLRRKYGLTHVIYRRLLARQGRKCPICQQGFSEARRPVVDHSHKTNRVRGLLCNWCNHRVVSMCERAGLTRVRNTLRYLWGSGCGSSSGSSISATGGATTETPSPS